MPIGVVRDVRLVRLAGRQFNRVSRAQLFALGFDQNTVQHLLTRHRLVIVEQGVLAIPPVLDDDWGRWMGATLTAPQSVLSHFSAAAAWQLWSRRRSFETITRPGSGGPRRHGGVLVYRSSTLEGDTDELRGIPITTVPRTVLDVACRTSTKASARVVREAIRLNLTSLSALLEYCESHRQARGTGQLRGVLARYSGLPLERARSGAEVRAMEVLREAGSCCRI